MAKQSNSAHIQFIADCLRNGEQRAAILAKFVEKWQGVTNRTFDRRLADAKKLLEGEQQRIQQRAEVLVAQEVDKRKARIMTSIERLELLTKIANGEIEIPTKEARWDPEQKKFVMLPVLELADHSARIRAVAEMNRMDGNYAPTKADITTTNTTPQATTAVVLNFDGNKIEILK